MRPSLCNHTDGCRRWHRPRLQVLLYKHAKTGAQLISVQNSDENKTFGVTFRTPVANSKVGRQSNL